MQTVGHPPTIDPKSANLRRCILVGGLLPVVPAASASLERFTRGYNKLRGLIQHQETNDMRPLMLMGTMAAIITMGSIAPGMAADAIPGSTVAVGPKGGPAVCGPRGGFAQKLNLSDEQLEKFHAIKTKYQLDTASKQAELKTLGIQLREILRAENIDKSAALATQGKINAIKNDLSIARLNTMIAKSEVLTSEQKKEIHHRMLQRESSFGGKHGGHHGRRGGHGGWGR